MSGAPTEDRSSGTGSGYGIWLTIIKPLSIMKETIKTSILERIFNSDLPVSSPVPSQQKPDTNDDPFTEMMRKQDLGKAMITLAIPIAVWVVASNNSSKVIMAHLVALGLMIGCMAIWNGILFRINSPRLANVLEQVGIGLVLLSFYSLIASFLPTELSWIMWVSGASCVIPFLVAPFYSM